MTRGPWARRPWLRVCRVALAVWIALLSGCATLTNDGAAGSSESQERTAEEAQQGEQESPRISYAPSGSCRTSETSAWLTAHRILRDYALARVVPLDMSSDGGATYGPWVAYDDFDAETANDEGMLTQWDEGYFITHVWSDYGQQILLMAPGDTVEINGRRIVVDGVFNYPKDAYLNEIRELLGWDCLVLQTCVPNTDLNRIVYGT